jgi:hypothetical protein
VRSGRQLRDRRSRPDGLRTATDRAGNSVSITVTDLDVDRTAPIVNVAGAINGDTYQLDESPTVTCTTVDATSGVANW